ncbi:imidazole glycerol phosphate synthase subunit HisF [Salmonella enterica subsp. enterica serovar Mountpleasant]|uniref:AglZ/HisF2 family acetamidino modification protein n=1 Tax=Salmonella TaxID=590 RepID=UPI000BA0ECA5|nr:MULTISPECIES: AglZ/HisF2 family acetamidino modification protein [Salmonella]EAO1509104.1 imidazole glycerol phosphate synthase subunit HisF [Salmonella enterica subsp. enterica serovar Bere]EAS0613912.1 imidazole glycerol phosphate synthase subunit HisF [Salmonella enterica subsp. enterica serovar Dahomey]EBH8662661.1 imidazole glycerol phosphate synthase subunit HisF [Salmonella enterica subsp. enterica serovar Luke]EBX5686386.1 imidazole glycerol phosphate synthase subunit HisF [Salmonell
MLRPRIIPCLLIHDSGLVKTINFKSPKYVGDPINAVKIFNEKEADELMVLDIDATSKGREPDYDLIKKLAAECRMPLCYGGGVTTAAQAAKIISLGVEKVSISTAAVENPNLVRELAEAVGKQSVVVVLDIIKRKGLFSKGYELSTRNNTRTHKIDPISFAQEMASLGAGEIVINYIDNDGVMKGYDIGYSSTIKSHVNVPVTFLGGAGSYEHLTELIDQCGIVGAAAGSLFVFKGKYRAVLISYPTPKQKDMICNGSMKNF